MKSIGSRYYFLDIAKGIAIISIIIGHLGVWGINRVVFTFHVPLFFLISGFFVNEKTSFKQFVYKRFKSLIIPYLITCLFVILFACALEMYKNGWSNVLPVAKRWIIASLYGAGDTYNIPEGVGAIGAIWFLLAMFWASIVLRLIIKYNHYFTFVFVITYFLGCIYTARIIWVPFALQASGPALLYMYIGYRVKHYDFSEITKLPLATKIICLLFGLGIWIWFIKDFKSFWLVHCDIGYGALDIFRSLIACIMVLIIAYCIEHLFKDRASIIEYLGQYSLVMLCAHLVELNTFPWDKAIGLLGVTNGSLLYLVLLISMKIAWCVVVSVILTTHNTTRRWFGYDRISHEGRTV